MAHLIDKHKNEIIEKFKKINNDNLNEENERDEARFNIEEEEKNNGDFSSSVNLNQGSTYPKTNNCILSSINIDDSDKFDEESQNNQNSNIQNSNYDSHNSNYTSNIEYNENNQFNPKNSNDCYKKEFNNLIYCNSKNNDIKCNCCPDHICESGCCLCVKCMKKNCIRFGLNKNQLINKEGRVATLSKGSYYCGCKYIKIIENVMGNKFYNNAKCESPCDSCESCKVLNKFKEEYSKIF